MTVVADADMAIQVYESGDGARFSAEALGLDPPARPEIAAFLEYWEMLRGDRPGPAEAELDPVAMRPYLSKVTLVRYRPAKDAFYFGLSGTEIFDLQKREISHTPVLSMRPAAYARMVDAHYREVLATGRPNSYRLCFETPEGRSSYDTVRVPLSEDGAAVTGLASVDVIDGRWRLLERYIDGLYARS